MAVHWLQRRARAAAPTLTLTLVLILIAAIASRTNAALAPLVAPAPASFSAATYTNPVQSAHDSPDPGVLYYKGAFYAVTTEGWGGDTFPIWKSTDAATWSHAGFIFPSGSLPAWTCCNHWAPELHLVNGHLLVYFTARDKTTQRLSIGVAASASGNVLGPWTPVGSGPLHQDPTFGTIDATVLDAGNGTHYLVWKIDGNAVAKKTPILAAELSPNGTAVVGPSVQLITNDQAWEGSLVEAPWIVKPSDSEYFYLFYSGWGFNSKLYAVGVARAKQPLGPYEKLSSNPILHTRREEDQHSFEGPGHCSVVALPTNTSKAARWIMVYHAWPHHAIGTKRELLVDTVNFAAPGGWPTVAPHGFPSEAPQPIPFAG